VELSDVIVHIGPLLSDSNTGGWSQTLPVQNLITLHPSYVRCRGKTWEDVHFVPVIKKLAARVLQDKGTERVVKKRFTDTEAEPSSPSGPLEQHHFWRQWSPFLEPGDLVIAEVGSAQYGTLELKLPAGAEFFTQLYYSCIGFTVGALLGAMVARRENGKTGRAILFVGDGSLQMTVQVRNMEST
jgi:pyruvate decarboxylase